MKSNFSYEVILSNGVHVSGQGSLAQDNTYLRFDELTRNNMSENNPDGTKDITNQVAVIKKSFVIAAREAIMLELLAIPGIGAVGAWCLRIFGKPFINWILNKLADWGELQAFFLNTAHRKKEQCKEYVKQMESGTDEEKIQAFKNFVRLSN